MHILHGLNGISSIALELHTIAIPVITRTLSEELLNIVAASEEWALVIVVDEVGIPLSTILTGEERCIRSHADHIGIALYMEQIQTFSEGIDEFLVLGSILA